MMSISTGLCSGTASGGRQPRRLRLEAGRQHLIALPKSSCRFGYHNLSASNLVVLPCSSSSRASDANCARVSSDSAKNVSHVLSDSISSNTHLARAFCSTSGNLAASEKAFSSMLVGKRFEFQLFMLHHSNLPDSPPCKLKFLPGYLFRLFYGYAG